MLRALVTGGAGFIGSYLVRFLLKEGVKVTVLDNFSTGKRENLLSQISNEGNLEIIEGDVLDASLCRRATQGCDTVFHLAAKASVPQSIADPKSYHDVNVTGSFYTLQAARASGVKRWIGASSSAVYGLNDQEKKSEKLPVSAISPYAATKIAQELYAQTFYHSYGLETVSLRYFNVYGPGQDPNSPYAAVIPSFIKAMVQGESPMIYGDGMQTRDFVFVEDVVAANVKAAKAKEAHGNSFNVASGEATTILQVFDILKELLDFKLEPLFSPARAGDILHSLADISAATEHLGYVPKVSLREGLMKTLPWFSK